MQPSTLRDFSEEYLRARAKHSWDGYSIDDGVNSIINELYELDAAKADNDLLGEHGVYREALQVAVVAIRVAELAAGMAVDNGN